MIDSRNLEVIFNLKTSKRKKVNIFKIIKYNITFLNLQIFP